MSGSRRRLGLAWLAVATAGGVLVACSSTNPPGSDGGSDDASRPDGYAIDASTDAAGDGAIDGGHAVTDASDGGETTVDAGPQDAGDAAIVDAALDGTPTDGATLDADATVDDGAVGTDGALDAGALDATLDGTVSDSGAEASSDGGTLSTIEVLQRVGGSSCVTCAEQAQCIATSGTCEDLVGYTAEAGSGAGRTRTSLCLDTLECVLGASCDDLATGDDLACYCGSAADCDAGPNGPCKAQEQAGLEQSSPAAIQDQSIYYSPILGAGRANNIVFCLANAGCAACFPSEQ